MLMRLLIKSIAGKVHKQGSNIRYRNGSLLKTDINILNRLAEHSKLLNLTVPERNRDPTSEALDIDCQAPNLLEIKQDIKRLRINKASGLDKIPAEVINPEQMGGGGQLTPVFLCVKDRPL